MANGILPSRLVALVERVVSGDVVVYAGQSQFLVRTVPDSHHYERVVGVSRLVLSGRPVEACVEHVVLLEALQREI